MFPQFRNPFANAEAEQPIDGLVRDAMYIHRLARHGKLNAENRGGIQDAINTLQQILQEQDDAR